MKILYNRCAFICFLFLLGCTSVKTNTDKSHSLPAAALHPFGRYAFTAEKKLELISSGVHFGFSFEGTECRVFARLSNSGHNYLQYVLDGEYQKRIKVTGNGIQAIVIKASGSGRHTAWIYKATEAHTGPILIEQITGTNLISLKVPNAPLIEFVGNSITCGAAADASEVPCGTGAYHDQHNAYFAYGPRVARALQANFILSSVSGIGVYRNWNSDGPTMPQVYEKQDFQNTTSQRWDFKQYQPQVVSIALGTNDFSKGDGKKERLPFDSARFVSNYIDFVKLVKSKYPEALIALLSSPMIGGPSGVTLQRCLNAVKAATDAAFPLAQPVALFYFKPLKARGCTGHPSVEDHAILAAELVPFFKTLLQ